MLEEALQHIVTVETFIVGVVSILGYKIYSALNRFMRDTIAEHKLIIELVKELKA